jgi:hypothetical protein
MVPYSQAEWDHQLERNTRVTGRSAVTGNAVLWKSDVFEKVVVQNTARALICTLRHRASGEVFSFANVVM